MAAATGLVAVPVHAHLVETGFGAFYNGMAHFALTPADLLVVVAIALWAGQRGHESARLTLLTLPLAWWVGGLVGAHWPSAASPVALTTLSFALVGTLVLLDARLRPLAVAGLVLIAGLLHGFVNGSTMAPGGAHPLALLGVVVAIFLVLAILAAEVTTLVAGWQRVAVRVVGSWIAAAGVLMLGWLARPLF